MVCVYRMGSFTSMPQIRPAPNAEDQDVDFGPNRVTLEAFLKRCRDELGNLPAVIPRQSRQRTTSLSKDGNEGFYISNAFALMNTEKIRVFQWNALSQGKSIIIFNKFSNSLPPFLFYFLLSQHFIVIVVKFSPVDVVLSKSKWKIVENPCRCSKIYLNENFKLILET